jgi:hypothetical protein
MVSLNTGDGQRVAYASTAQPPSSSADTPSCRTFDAATTNWDSTYRPLCGRRGVHQTRPGDLTGDQTALQPTQGFDNATATLHIAAALSGEGSTGAGYSAHARSAAAPLAGDQADTHYGPSGWLGFDNQSRSRRPHPCQPDTPHPFEISISSSTPDLSPLLTGLIVEIKPRPCVGLETPRWTCPVLGGESWSSARRRR